MSIIQDIASYPATIFFMVLMLPPSFFHLQVKKYSLLAILILHTFQFPFLPTTLFSTLPHTLLLQPQNLPLQKTCLSTVILCYHLHWTFLSQIIVRFPFSRLGTLPCLIALSSLLLATARAQLPHDCFLQAPVGFEGFLLVSHSCVETLSQQTCKCCLSTPYKHSCTDVWSSC